MLITDMSDNRLFFNPSSLQPPSPLLCPIIFTSSTNARLTSSLPISFIQRAVRWDYIRGQIGPRDISIFGSFCQSLLHDEFSFCHFSCRPPFSPSNSRHNYSNLLAPFRRAFFCPFLNRFTRSLSPSSFVPLSETAEYPFTSCRLAGFHSFPDHAGIPEGSFENGPSLYSLNNIHTLPHMCPDRTAD
ncbi:unnamed protein product [Protopolystoma xenopodis]|uniref:Uncharacterized protein n=1 Tax=Protopolystoma xenopodis TaxID=117903 RepID=A0A448XHV0_9PLAT|nr:unnamed protein product [Protopolystoma xenopodis]